MSNIAPACSQLIPTDKEVVIPPTAYKFGVELNKLKKEEGIIIPAGDAEVRENGEFSKGVRKNGVLENTTVIANNLELYKASQENRRQSEQMIARLKEKKNQTLGGKAQKPSFKKESEEFAK